MIYTGMIENYTEHFYSHRNGANVIHSMKHKQEENKVVMGVTVSERV